MKDKKIVVTLKYFKGELNPFDGAALECAIETGAKDITVVSMAPMSALNAFQSLTRLGVKGVFISDSLYAGSDTQATSQVLAEAIKRLRPDLIFCGRQSIDGDTAQVPPMLAQRLGFSIKAKVIQTDGTHVTLRSGETFTPEDRTVLTFERIRTLRFPSIFSKQREVEIWDNDLLGLSTQNCGLNGSPTRVIKSYESNVGRRNCTFVGLAELPRLIDESLQKSRTEQAENTGEQLDEIYFVGDIENVAKSVAKRALRLDAKNKTSETLAREIKGKTVLWEDTDELKLLAPQVAVLTGAGICADCISFRVEAEKMVMTRPAQGGNIMADIICTSDTAFATVRTVKKGVSDVIFSVGKGAIEQIDKIKAVAEKYNAEICCSRIVADSGKLPYEKQVGLTGKTVGPKVYVAIGISGAVQHTCAISGAGTVIAINSDKNARIFDYADYGVVAEVLKMLVGLKEILNLAERGDYCIPAFNVYNLETAKGVMNAAEKLRAPVILQFYSRLVTSKVAEDVAPIVLDMAQKASVPVCFHLDHGAGECEVVRSLRMGMTGIMIDASTEPLEENIAKTKAAVKLCEYVGVGVEGELGHIGKAAEGDENTTAEYTHPDEAKKYVEETGVCALAVMVGTAHGRYKKAPVLDVERIKAIKKETAVALVLHGGSGVPDEQIQAAIKAGIRKMNFSTDLCYSFLDACRERDKSIVGIDLFMAEPIARVQNFAETKIKVLGANDRV